MYSGTTRLAPPIANPTMLLPNIMDHTLLVKACHSAPTVNSTSAMRMIFFRPSLSARTPDIGLAMSANRLVQDVMRLLSRVVSSLWERSVPMETRVEDMTPVLFKGFH